MTDPQHKGGWTPGELDFEAVASGVLDAIRPVVEREMKEAANQLYGATMEAVQDYLSDNVNFNIRSRLEAAERERRAQWERAEAAEKANVDLYAACAGAAKTFRRYEAMHNEKGTVEGAQKAAANASFAKSLEDALAKASPDKSGGA